ncbi:MAG TPA: immunoglobulin domain-containing protein [Verrucomicrobiae bacterium]|nr:immunoglobulin domain-containing protein [Verrucomicrobiae bacterium]
MSYCEDSTWPSVFTYTNMLTYLQTPGLGEPAAAPQRLIAHTMSVPPRLLVRAAVDITSKAVLWLPIMCTPDGSFDSPVPGEFALQARAGDGSLLDEVSFDLKPTSEGRRDPEPFDSLLSFAIPYQAAIRTLELRHMGALVSTLSASPNPPVTHVISPNGGEIVAGDTLTFLWEAADADGDALTYNVQFSADGGGNWSTIGTGLKDTHLTVTRSTLPGSSNALFRVLASDGFNCSLDESDGTWTLPDVEPTIALRSFPEDQRLFADHPQILEVFAFDREDGILEGTNIVWYSDRDGYLGSGSSLTSPRSLSSGTHLITVQAIDALGNKGTAAVLVEVGPFLPPKLSVSADAAKQQVILNVSGSPRRRLRIESSLDLTAWNELASVPFLASQLLVTQAIRSDSLGKFFRARFESLSPTILQQPTDQLLRAGQGFTLDVEAVGGEALNYYWLLNGAPVPAARNSATLVVTNAQAGMSGIYSVVLSNQLGVLESRQIHVTVTNQPPTITREPQDIVAGTGHPFTLSVQAESTQPLQYYWRENGSSISGAPNSASLSIAGISPAQVAHYSVIVSNSLGVVESREATVTVIDLVPTFCNSNAPSRKLIDIGRNSRGSYTSNAPGSYTIVGGGIDIWDNMDEFTFLYEEATGDFDVRVRVENLSATARWSKAASWCARAWQRIAGWRWCESRRPMFRPALRKQGMALTISASGIGLDTMNRLVSRATTTTVGGTKISIPITPCLLLLIQVRGYDLSGPALLSAGTAVLMGSTGSLLRARTRAFGTAAQ